MLTNWRARSVSGRASGSAGPTCSVDVVISSPCSAPRAGFYPLALPKPAVRGGELVSGAACVGDGRLRTWQHRGCSASRCDSAESAASCAHAHDFRPEPSQHTRRPQPRASLTPEYTRSADMTSSLPWTGPGLQETTVILIDVFCSYGNNSTDGNNSGRCLTGRSWLPPSGVISDEQDYSRSSDRHMPIIRERHTENKSVSKTVCMWNEWMKMQ